ncbi:N-acetyltransferase family protein [Paracidovorax citrulli]
MEQRSEFPRPSLPQTVTLANGTGVCIREVTAEDKQQLLAAFEALSPESRYTRFFAPLRHVSDSMLEAATHPKPHEEFALVAVTLDQGTIVAGARYGRAPGSATCEFAVTVADDWHRQGLARRLMSVLIEAARHEGFRTMEGYVLSTNAGMRKLARQMGFADVASPGDATTRVVSLRLHADMEQDSAQDAAQDAAGAPPA